MATRSIHRCSSVYTLLPVYYSLLPWKLYSSQTVRITSVFTITGVRGCRGKSLVIDKMSGAGDGPGRVNGFWLGSKRILLSSAVLHRAAFVPDCEDDFNPNDPMRERLKIDWDSGFLAKLEAIEKAHEMVSGISTDGFDVLEKKMLDHFATREGCEKEGQFYNCYVAAAEDGISTTVCIPATDRYIRCISEMQQTISYDQAKGLRRQTETQEPEGDVVEQCKPKGGEGGNDDESKENGNEPECDE